MNWRGCERSRKIKWTEGEEIGEDFVSIHSLLDFCDGGREELEGRKEVSGKREMGASNDYNERKDSNSEGSKNLLWCWN